MGFKIKLILEILGVLILVVLTFLASGFITSKNTEKLKLINTDEFFQMDEQLEVALDREARIAKYEKEKEEKIKKLLKRDLSGEIVSVNNYGIIEDMPIVNASQLLPTDTWRDYSFNFNNINLILQYPTDKNEQWYTQDILNKNQFILTTNKAGNPANVYSCHGEEQNSCAMPDSEIAWAKMTFGLYKRTATQSVFDWMQESSLKDGLDAPPFDLTVQYVMIGKSKFLGSVFFEEHTWADKKNVYAEISPTLIFAATLEVQNMDPSSEAIREFDQVFYTILESLEVK